MNGSTGGPVRPIDPALLRRIFNDSRPSTAEFAASVHRVFGCRRCARLGHICRPCRAVRHALRPEPTGWRAALIRGLRA